MLSQTNITNVLKSTLKGALKTLKGKTHVNFCMMKGSKVECMKGSKVRQRLTP